MDYAMRHAEYLLETPAAMMRWYVDNRPEVHDLEDIWTKFLLYRGYDRVEADEDELRLEVGIQRCTIPYPLHWAARFHAQLPFYTRTKKPLLRTRVMDSLIYAWEHME